MAQTNKQKKQSQQPFLHRRLSCKLLSTKLPLAEPALIRVSWNPISTNWIEAFSIQSEQLYSDQSGPVPLDQTVRIWMPHVHEDRPIRDQGGDFCPLKPAFLWLGNELSTEDRFSPATVETWEMPRWSRPELPGQRESWPKGDLAPAVFTAALHHN